MKNKKTELKSKNKVNTKVWIFALVLIIFFIVLITVSLKNNASKLKGTARFEIPANTAFKDNNFYRCVVNAYNEENNTKHDINYNLSDVELTKITKLDCDRVEHDINENLDVVFTSRYGFTKEYEKKNEIEKINAGISSVSGYMIKGAISDFTGIEKLSNITTLYAEHVNGGAGNLQLAEYNEKVDLSKNIKLLDLKILTDSRETIDLSKNVNLENFTLVSSPNGGSSRRSITGFSNLTNLKTLNSNLDVTEFSEVGKLTNLTSISLKYSVIKNLDVIKPLTKLTSISLIDNDGDLSSLSYVANLKSLTLLGSSRDSLKSIPQMPFLTDLKYSGSLDNVDFAKFPNLVNLTLNGTKTGLTKLSDLTNLTHLTKLQNLSIIMGNNNINLSGIESLLALKSLNIPKGGAISAAMPKIETIIGYVDDFSKVPNLKKLIIPTSVNPSNIKNSETLPNINELVLTNDWNGNNIMTLFNSINSFPNLTSLISEVSITTDLLVKMPKLTYLDGFTDSMSVIDVSNNVLLKTLYLTSNWNRIIGYEKLVNLEELKIADNSTMTFNFNTMPKLKSLSVGYSRCNMSSLNVKENPNLTFLSIVGCPITDFDFSANSKLKYLNLNQDGITSIDLSNNKELSYLLFSADTTNSQQGIPTDLIKDLPISSFQTLKLPEQFIATSCITNNAGNISKPSAIAKCENGKIVGNMAGTRDMSFEFSGPVAYRSAIDIETIINVSDVSFNKYNYKKGTDYIFTGSDTKER
ncbi:MAG: hypothetical protein RSA10_02645, partial [Bacilli bacterium]